jgi:hypothetical protein
VELIQNLNYRKISMHIYLEITPNSGFFNYRGEAGLNDDPEAFAVMMAKKELRVLQKEQFEGSKLILEEDDK